MSSGGMGDPQWIDVKGIRTRYFDRGAGEVIVFVHGLHMGHADNACTAVSWKQNFGPLAEHHNCIAIETLGQGFTANPEVDADYTMDATVKHLAATLDAIGKSPYHLVGHSRGGYIVSRLALERPDLAKTCVPISSGTLSPGVPRNRLVHRHRPYARLSREAQRWTSERYSYNPRIVDSEWLDEAVSVAETERNAIAVRKMNDDGLLNSQFMPQLHKQKLETFRWLLEKGIPCPTLVVWGLHDPTADFEVGQLLIEMYMRKQPETEVKIFNKTGHFVFVEYAAAFNRALHAWVTRHI